MAVNDGEIKIDQIVLTRPVSTGFRKTFLVNLRNPKPEHLDVIEAWVQDVRANLRGK